MTDNPHEPALSDLDRRLQQARDRETAADVNRPSIKPAPSGLGIAFRVGVELVSALAVGVGLGLLLDYWLGTGPWFLIVFFFLGSGAGILNVYRAARGLGLGVGYRRPDSKS